MPIPKRLEDLLKERHIEYRSVVHSEAYTAQEVAATMHIKGKELAKPVLIKADGALVMTVLPASSRVDFSKLRQVLDKKDIRLASEDEFRDAFPDCETGAEPPFGNLYDVDTIVDKSLTEDTEIFFNAGTHYEALEMSYRDFADLVRPKVADIGKHL